jgi:hypothetical protein
LIPTRLEDWNYETIQQLADNYMEGDNFDFKYAIKSKEPSERDNLIQTVCAFANTKGGFLVYGVHRNSNGKNEIRGLEKYDNYSRDFGDKISSIDPTVYFVASKFISIPDTDKILFVTHIPLSPQRPHMTDKGNFYYRTNKGNEIMGHSEVKDEFLRFEERRHKLRLLYSELITNKEIAETLVTNDAELGRKYPITEFQTDVIINLLPDVYYLIQDNRDLLRALLDLRIKMEQTKSRVQLAKSAALQSNAAVTIALSTEINLMVKVHVLPRITEIRTILEKQYHIKNPFQE